MKNSVFRDGKPDDYITISTGYPYLTIEQSKLEIFNKLLDDIFPNKEVQDYYKVIMANALCGVCRFEEFYIHTGGGGNGKGLLGDLMNKVFGEYGSTVSANVLCLASTNKNEATPELANKKGKRLVLASELPIDATLQMAQIKQWTGGDKISARALYGATFEFKPQFTLNIQCNDMPNIPKIDDSIIRRTRVFHYPIKFCENPNENNKFEKKSDPYLKEIINNDPELWNAVVQTLLNVYESHKTDTYIQVPNACQEFTKKYLSDNDKIKTWFDERIEICEDSKLKPSALYGDYCYWIGKNEKKLSSSIFGSTITDRFKVEKKKSHGIFMYNNIKLKVNNEDFDDGD